MEYLQDKEYFPFKTVIIIDDSLQINLVKKNASVIWNLFDFITYWYSYYSQLHEATYFSYKYVLHLNKGKTSPKGSY